MISNELKDWKAEAKVTSHIMYRYSICNEELTICTSQPGWLIGKAGCLINKYTEILSNKLGHVVTIKLVETCSDVI